MGSNLTDDDMKAARGRIDYVIDTSVNPKYSVPVGDLGQCGPLIITSDDNLRTAKYALYAAAARSRDSSRTAAIDEMINKIDDLLKQKPPAP